MEVKSEYKNCGSYDVLIVSINGVSKSFNVDFVPSNLRDWFQTLIERHMLEWYQLGVDNTKTEFKDFFNKTFGAKL